MYLKKLLLSNRRINLIKLVFAALLLAGCLAGNAGCRDNEPDTASDSRLACIEMMERVPVYYDGFTFWDVKSLRNEPELGLMYEAWKERKWSGNKWGIETGEIDCIAESDVLLQVQGGFDISMVRSAITAAYLQDTAREDIELWESRNPGSPAGPGGSILLEKETLVWGNDFNIEDYIRVVNGEEVSMYDANAARLLDRLPDGITLSISRQSYPDGLIISGGAVTKEPDGNYRWTNVYMFDSPAAAGGAAAGEYFDQVAGQFEEAAGQMSDRGKELSVSEFNIERDGEFVTWSVVIGQTHMISLLFYG